MATQEQMLTPEEQKYLSDHEHVRIPIKEFKWKNNSTRSWVLAIASFAAGLVFLAGVAFFPLASFHLAVWLTVGIRALAAFIGLALFLNGVIELATKTIFQRTKYTGEIKTADDSKRSGSREEKKSAPKSAPTPSPFSQLTNLLSPLVPSKKTVAGGMLAVGGGAGGYFAGTATAAKATLALATLGIKIKATLFVGMCALGGAIVLPLLGYACWQIYLRRESIKRQLNRFYDWLPSRRKVGMATLVTAGAVGGGFAGNAAVASTFALSTGLSASLFIAACAASGGLALASLLLCCTQINNCRQPAVPYRRL